MPETRINIMPPGDSSPPRDNRQDYSLEQFGGIAHRLDFKKYTSIHYALADDDYRRGALLCQRADGVDNDAITADIDRFADVVRVTDFGEYLYIEIEIRVE